MPRMEPRMFRTSSPVSLALCLALALHFSMASGCTSPSSDLHDENPNEGSRPTAHRDETTPINSTQGGCTDRFVESAERIEPFTDACTFDGDPRLARIAAAACRGVQWIVAHDEAHEGLALILVDMIARRFGIKSLLALWDRAEPSPDSAKSHDERILMRISDARVLASEADFEKLHSPIDRFTTRALFCRELGFPEGYAETLRENTAHGDYEATHVLLAFFWMEERGCTLPESDEIRAEAIAITASLIDHDHNEITDLELEAAAFLAYEGAANRIPVGFLEGVLAAQSEDGGFADGAKGDLNLHASALGLWYLHELLYPNRRTPLVNPCLR